LFSLLITKLSPHFNSVSDFQESVHETLSMCKLLSSGNKVNNHAVFCN